MTWAVVGMAWTFACGVGCGWLLFAHRVLRVELAHWQRVHRLLIYREAEGLGRLPDDVFDELERRGEDLERAVFKESVRRVERRLTRGGRS